jgi:hypothetical protein
MENITTSICQCTMFTHIVSEKISLFCDLCKKQIGCSKSSTLQHTIFVRRTPHLSFLHKSLQTCKRNQYVDYQDNSYSCQKRQFILVHPGFEEPKHHHLVHSRSIFWICKGIYNGREGIPSLSPSHHLEKA